MILALMLACGSTPEAEQNPPERPLEMSVFQKECAAPSSEQIQTTLQVIFDRVGSTDCKEVHRHLSTTKSLNLANHPTPFSDVSILSAFTQIEEIYLSDSLVADLTPFTNYTALRKLHLEHCPVEKLQPLSSLSTLEDLLLDYTNVSDLSPLKNLHSLKRIGLRNTSISSLTGVSSLKSLTSLEASGTNISSIEPLSSLGNLEIVSLRQSSISDLQPLSNHSKLFFLDIKHTKVKDLEPLQALSNMKVLDIGHSKVTDLSPLRALSSLIELNVQGISVDAADCSHFSQSIRGCSALDADPLFRLCTSPEDFGFTTQISMASLRKDLQEEDCRTIKQKVETLTQFTTKEPYPDPRIFSYFPKLQTLDIPVRPVFFEYCPAESTNALSTLCERKKRSMQNNMNAVTDSFLKDCNAPERESALTYKALKSKLKITSCEELWQALALTERLSLQDSKLSSLDPLKRLPNLQELSVEYNEISDLSPLSDISGLQILWIDDNQIEDLRPLKDLPLLWLGAGDNKIKDISPLQKSVTLRRLWLGGNQIRDISALQNLTNLQKLHLAINQIDDITALSPLLSLSSLYLGYNAIRDIGPLGTLSGLHVLSSGLDNEESPLEMQRWFLQGNPIAPQSCPKENAPTAVALFCSQYN